MQNSLLESVRSQPHSVHGLIMVDDNVEHLQVCLESCCNVLSQLQDPGRALIVLDKSFEATKGIKPSNSSLRLDVVFWNTQDDSLALARNISELKRRREWGLIFLGAIDMPWMESAGRMCDQVYLSIPADTQAGFRTLKSKLAKLQKAGVRFSGSYVTAKAA